MLDIIKVIYEIQSLNITHYDRGTEADRFTETENYEIQFKTV